MHEVTITSEAIDNLHAMNARAHKAHVERETAIMANMDADLAEVLEDVRKHRDHIQSLLTSLLTGLDIARQVPNGRVYADLDGLEFRGSLHGGIVDHGNGDIRVHT